MTEITQADRDAAAAYLDEDGQDWPLQDLVLIKGALFCATEDPSLEQARRILFAMVPILYRHRMEERAAIVAWLRSGGCWETIPYRVEEAYHIAANDIEAGEHNK